MNAPRSGSVRLHIGHLVLHGFSPEDRPGIVDALTRELSAVIAREGVAPQSVTKHKTDGGEFTMGSARRATLAGEGIAQAIHTTIRR